MQIGLSSLPDRAPDPTATDPGAQTSGPGFDRLVAAAQAEADRRRAIAAQSGASADQFTEQSWLQIFKAHGGEIGFGPAANAITKDSHGQWTILDPALRAKVLNYRNDNVLRAVMAVKRATDGKVVLSAELGRRPSDAEMRVAEVVGGKAAAKLILTRQSTPNASAALTVPDAAKANRALFYRPDGSPQTIDEVVTAAAKPPAPNQTEVAARALAGHPPAPGGAAPPGLPASLGQLAASPGQTGQPTTFADTARLNLSQAQHKRPGPPPDLALVAGTIGNLSMPGSASGTSAPTGGKLSGWRAQIAGEVTHQVEHPESVVTNAPSNVTIPAPAAVRRPYPVAPLAGAPFVTSPQSQLLGPELVPSTSAPQPIPPVAYAPPAASPVSAAPVAQPPAAVPLPQLVASGTSLPPEALPLLPVEVGQGPLPLGPQPSGPQTAGAQTAGPQASDNQPVAAVPEPQPQPVVVRPSRYGPDAGHAAVTLPPMNALGYAATPSIPSPSLADAAVSGTRPSRIFVGAAVAAQAFASGPPQGPAPVAQPASPAYGQQAYAQSIATQAAAVDQPVDGVSALGPDGVPILPPVPPRAGLPPITASQALQPGPLDETTLMSGTKPLDLAPSVAAAAPVQTVQQPPRPRPRNIPAFLSRT